MTVSLEEFIKYLIKKWKMLAVVVAFLGVVFAGITFWLDEEIVVPHSEEYLYYEQEVEYLKSYQKNSILMNLDPTCIYERTVFVKNISDKTTLMDYVNSSEIWMDFETDRPKMYIWQLISWYDTGAADAVEIKVKHATSEECMDCADYLKTALMKKDPSLEISIGLESIIVDEELQKEHLRWYERIDYAESLLLNSQAGYTIKVNKAAAAIAGVLVGGMSAVAVGLFSYINQRKKEQRK